MQEDGSIERINNEHISLLISGDKEAFAKIFESYYKKLVFFIKEFLNDTEVAKEIAQDTFIKLWEIKESLLPNTNITGLLYTIARNKSLNYLKQLSVTKKYLKSHSVEQNRLSLNQSSLDNNVFNFVIYNELNEKILEAIDKLPPRSKEIFKLSRNKGLSYKEIAQKLNISVNTVENLMVTTLKKLRETLKKYYPQP